MPPPTTPPSGGSSGGGSSSGGGGGGGYSPSEPKVGKNYEVFNSTMQEFVLNESNEVNIQGTNYSFILFTINESFARINVSNYGIIRFNIGQPKTFNKRYCFQRNFKIN